MKTKQPKLSKVQIAAQLKLKQEAEHGKNLVRDVLFPLLKKYATTIANSERITEVFKVAIMQAMQIPFKDKLVGELDFQPMLDEEKGDKSEEIFRACIEAFKDVKIADAVKILNEYEGGVSTYMQMELQKREFTSLALEDLIGPQK